MSDRSIHAPSAATPAKLDAEDSVKVKLVLTKMRGMALVAVGPIQAGEKLLPFNGEIYEWGHTTVNLPNIAPLFTRDHCIQIGESTSRDTPGWARYANHSCEPNCGITDCIWITAMTDIAPGTEITWDYAMTEDNDWKMECTCDSPQCRKIIAGYRHLPPERREAYRNFTSTWLTEKERPYLGPAPVSNGEDIGV